MALSLEQLRAAYKTPEKFEKGNLPNNYYPFWNAPIGELVVIRFLPDKNPENPFGFLVEKVMHTLMINGESKSVPCLKMYNEDCPICKVSAQYYSNNDKVNGKKYWRKKQHIAQALVVADPIPANEQTKETHEGKVRYMAIGYKLYNIIKDAFEGGILDEIPYAYKGGTNFIIKRSKQGDFSDYTIGSRFDRVASDLTDDEIAMVQDKLIDLSTLLPRHPGLDKVELMLDAAISGGTLPVDVATSTPAEVGVDNDEAPTTGSAGGASLSSIPATPGPHVTTQLDTEAEAILARIRNRKNKQA